MTLWWYGPNWLKTGDWSIDALLKNLTSEEIDDIDTQTESVNHVKTSHMTSPETNLDEVIDMKRFNTLSKLLKVTSYMSCFINNIRCKGTPKSGELDASEIQNAKLLWIKHIQQKAYGEEIAELQKNSTTNILIKQLGLFLDKNNMIHCRGRLQNAPIPENARIPILIPSYHQSTKLMIVDAHKKVKHSGIQATMNHLRQNYWIPKMRAMVKSTLRYCITCKKLTGQPYPKVVTAQLPGFCTQQTAPFAVTGVDFTGALSARSQNDGKIRECYICLSTCANTQAIHLELVSNLSTQRRFAARRSFPQLMISDNATTFQCAAKSLQEMSKSGEIAKFMSTQAVKWTFSAPWFGGFWKRLIGMTKMALKKVIIAHSLHTKNYKHFSVKLKL